MNDNGLVSIIINNYNYGTFLSDAIDSALKQTYPNVEVIVVDDGSIDNSKEVIKFYGNSIISIFQENTGQSGACNSGFLQSKGDIIIFLDADDILLPTASRTAIEALHEDEDLSKVHWYQWEIDKAGIKTGQKHPSRHLSEGDFFEEIVNGELPNSIICPTSGNAWKRNFIQAVFPIQERGDKHGADGYLCRLAPIFGKIKLIEEPQGLYRKHGLNFRNSKRRPYLEKLKADIKRHDSILNILAAYLTKKGFSFNADNWRKPDSSFDVLKKRLLLFNTVENNVPKNSKIILADDQFFKRDDLDNYIFPNHKIVPFLESNGTYQGTPEKDEQLIHELMYEIKRGAEYMLFLWPTFWWLEYYDAFYEHLNLARKKIKHNRACIIYDLTKDNFIHE